MDQTLKLGVLSVAVTCCALMVATPVLSQSVAAPQLADGLFGATRSQSGGRDRLDVVIDASERLDSDLPAEFRSQIAQGDLQSGGLSTMLIGSAEYARNRRRTQVAATVSSAFRYYPRLARVTSVSDSAGLGVSVRLPKQGSLQIGQTAAYSPSYLYQLVPTAAPPTLGESIPVDPYYRIDPTRSYLYGSNMALAFGSASGTRVTTTAAYSHTDFQVQPAARSDPTTYMAGAKVSRAVSHNGGLSVEYDYRAAKYGFDGRTKEHRLTMGVQYALPVSRTRRATFRLDVTPARLELPELALNIDNGLILSAVEGALRSAGVARLYQLQGEADVAYEFRPYWRATGDYRRGIEYLAILTQPVLTDGAHVGLIGLIGRRVDVSAAAGYATGASAINLGTQRLETRTADVRIRYALRRSLALYSEYLYSYYDLRGQASLAPGLPTRFNQSAVRVGFMLYAQPLSR